MLTAVIIAIALLAWAIQLVEQGWRSKEEVRLLAGALVLMAAGAVLLVWSLMARVFGA